MNLIKRIKEYRAKKKAEAQARHEKNIAFMQSQIDESKAEMLKKECVIQRRQCFEGCSFFEQGEIAMRVSGGETTVRFWQEAVPCRCSLKK